MRRLGNESGKNNKYYAPYIFLFLCFLILHMINCRYNLIWGDEGFSLKIVQYKSVKEMMTAIINDVHPPLYYFWLKLVGYIFGENIYAYKIASGVFYYLTMVMFWVLYRKEFRNKALFFCVICFGTMPALKHVHEIRMYPMALFFVSAFTFISDKILKKSGNTSKRYYLLLAVIGICASYTHYFALLDVFVIMLLFIVYSAEKHDKVRAGYFFLTGCVIFAAYIPWLSIILKQAAGGNSSTVNIKELIISIASYAAYFIDDNNVFLLVLTIAVLAIIIIAFLINLQRGNIGNERKYLFNLVTVIIVFAANVFAAVAMTKKAHFFTGRYMYPLFGLTLFVFCILMQNLLNSLKNDLAGNIIFGGLITIIILNGMSYEYNFLHESDRMQKDTYRIVNEIRSSADISTLIITNSEQVDWTVLDYYFPDYQHYLLEDKSITESDYENCWYLLDCGTDIGMIEKAGKKMLYVDTGFFGDGYSMDLYKTVNTPYKEGRN